MRLLLFIFIFVSSQSFAGLCDSQTQFNGPTYKSSDYKKKVEIELSKSVFDHGDFKFSSRSGTYGTYFTLDIPYAPVEAVYNQVKDYKYPNLKNRGEAHITVLTPVEYQCYFAKSQPIVTMKEIEAAVRKKVPAKIKYKVLALGSGMKVMNGKKEETFFIINESSDLVNVRKIIWELLDDKMKAKFDPGHFYPHTTVGFTKRDLHESDAILKDMKHAHDHRFLIKEN